MPNWDACVDWMVFYVWWLHIPTRGTLGIVNLWNIFFFWLIVHMYLANNLISLGFSYIHSVLLYMECFNVLSYVSEMYANRINVLNPCNLCGFNAKENYHDFMIHNLLLFILGPFCLYCAICSLKGLYLFMCWQKWHLYTRKPCLLVASLIWMH